MLPRHLIILFVILVFGVNLEVASKAFNVPMNIYYPCGYHSE